MKFIKKLLIILLTFIVLKTSYLYSQELMNKKKRFRVDSVVAIVNDEIITMTDLQRSIIPLIKQLKGKYTGRELQEKIMEASTTVLNQLVDNKLILQTAKHLRDNEELKISEKQILTYVKKIIDRFPSKKIFEETLKRENISYEDFKKDCVEQLLVKELVGQKVSSKVLVSNSDIKEFYEKNKDSYTTPERITFIQIWLKKEGKDIETKNKLKDILKEIKDGLDFKTAAIQYSMGPHAKEGGIWKNVKRGQFTKELDDAIWSLVPGQISEIIETPFSFHIVRVEVKENSSVKIIDDVWDEIQGKIYVERAEEIRNKWIDSLKKDAYIEIFDKSLSES